MTNPLVRDPLSATRLYVMTLDKDPAHAFANPALAAMVAEGWTLFHAFAWVGGDEIGDRIILVLQPPRPSESAIARPVRISVGVGLVIAVELAIVIAFLLGYFAYIATHW